MRWVVLLLLLAGCADEAAPDEGPEMVSSTTETVTITESSSSTPTTTISTTTTSTSSTTAPEPVDQGPDLVAPPGAGGVEWGAVTFEADMPAGTWLYLYIDLPGTVASDLERFPLQVEVEGEATDSGASAHMAIKPFLIEDGRNGNEVETFFIEEDIAVDPDGKAWHFEPFFDDIHPFGHYAYHGIVFMAAASTPWSVSLRIESPWGGNGTYGPDVVAWGEGFTFEALPDLAVSGAAEQDHGLDWDRALAEGWTMAVAGPHACYVEDPCTDVVTEEEWQFSFPKGSYDREFRRTATSGTPPYGAFGTLAAGAGTMEVDATATGFIGARNVHILHAPIPPSVWPVTLTDSSYW